MATAQAREKREKILKNKRTTTYSREMKGKKKRRKKLRSRFLLLLLLLLLLLHHSIIIIIINTYYIIYIIIITHIGRSQWPRRLRRKSAAARLLGLWVRMPSGAWTSVSCECCVLSGRGLCVRLTTRPEQSYRVWCV